MKSLSDAQLQDSANTILDVTHNQPTGTVGRAHMWKRQVVFQYILDHLVDYVNDAQTDTFGRVFNAFLTKHEKAVLPVISTVKALSQALTGLTLAAQAQSRASTTVHVPTPETRVKTTPPEVKAAPTTVPVQVQVPAPAQVKAAEVKTAPAASKAAATPAPAASTTQATPTSAVKSTAAPAPLATLKAPITQVQSRALTAAPSTTVPVQVQAVKAAPTTVPAASKTTAEPASKPSTTSASEIKSASAPTPVPITTTRATPASAVKSTAAPAPLATLKTPIAQAPTPANDAPALFEFSAIKPKMHHPVPNPWTYLFEKPAWERWYNCAKRSGCQDQHGSDDEHKQNISDVGRWLVRECGGAGSCLFHSIARACTIYANEHKSSVRWPLHVQGHVNADVIVGDVEQAHIRQWVAELLELRDSSPDDGSYLFKQLLVCADKPDDMKSLGTIRDTPDANERLRLLRQLIQKPEFMGDIDILYLLIRPRSPLRVTNNLQCTFVLFENNRPGEKVSCNANDTTHIDLLNDKDEYRHIIAIHHPWLHFTLIGLHDEHDPNIVHVITPAFQLRKQYIMRTCVKINEGA